MGKKIYDTHIDLILLLKKEKQSEKKKKQRGQQAQTEFKMKTKTCVIVSILTPPAFSPPLLKRNSSVAAEWLLGLTILA